MENSKYSKYIVQQLQTPVSWGFERKEGYARWAKRVLWLDDEVIKGAFQMNCSWYFKTPTDKTAESSAPHSHNSDEVLGFFGGDPENPHDLGAEIEFWIEDEKFMLTKSSLIFIPKGLKHCPLIMIRLDRPIFHFSALIEGRYQWASGNQP